MKSIRRYVVVAVTSGVAVASLAVPSDAATKHPVTTNASAAAAGFLARHLVGAHHDHYNGSYVSDGETVTYVNYGETADAILSMDAAGVAQSAAARATSYLAAHVGAYAGTSADNYSPGAIGKLMLVAEADRLVRAKTALAVAAELPDCTVLRFGPESAHEILREADPVRDRALAAIDSFLDARAPAL